MKTELSLILPEDEDVERACREIYGMAANLLSSKKRIKKKLSMATALTYKHLTKHVLRSDAFSRRHFDKTGKRNKHGDVLVHVITLTVTDDRFNFYPLLDYGMVARKLNVLNRPRRKSEDFREVRAPFRKKVINHMRLACHASEWGYEENEWSYDGQASNHGVFLYTKQARMAFMLGLSEFLKEIPEEIAAGNLPRCYPA